MLYKIPRGDTLEIKKHAYLLYFVKYIWIKIKN